MNRLLFSIVVLVILGMEVSTAFGQINSGVSVGEQPCIEGHVPGRPTLKRRQPAPETALPDDGSLNQKKLLEKEKCKQEGAPADPLNNQKPTAIEFEGLHALSASDMVRAFGERGIVLSKTALPNPEVRGYGSGLRRTRDRSIVAMTRTQAQSCFWLTKVSASQFRKSDLKGTVLSLPRN